MSDNKLTLLIMAGGTGGHVMPALSVAQRLMDQGFDVQWLGTHAGIEANLVPKANIPMHYIHVKGLRGNGLLGWLKAPFRVSKAFFQSFKVIRQVKPKAVISMGGYVAGPGGIAAWCLRIPLIVHEQNALSGMTNRLLAPFAKKILTAFPKTFAYSKVAITGNPVRESIIHVGDERSPRTHETLRVLVIGGSLGARALNQTVPRAIKAIESQTKVEIRHQTGKNDIESTRKLYLGVESKFELTSFIDDMAKAYHWADIVICRSGALTIAELAAAGVPSILIPFPHAVDDHQSYNARYLTDAGAAVLLPQSELSATKLSDLILTLANDRDKLLDMSNKSKSLAKPEATEQVANYFVEVSRGKSASFGSNQP